MYNSRLKTSFLVLGKSNVIILINVVLHMDFLLIHVLVFLLPSAFSILSSKIFLKSIRFILS